MIDIKALEKHPEKFRESLGARNGDPTEIDRLLALNERRKTLITEMETMKAEQNRVSGEIAQLKKNKQDASTLLESMQGLSKKIKDFQVEAEKADKDVFDLAAVLPNLCHETTPRGSSVEQNVCVRTVGSPKKFSFKPKEHSDLGEALGILDFATASKVTGARFSILKGLGSRLERALINFMLDVQTKEHGYEETTPPYMVNSASLFGTSQLPKFKQDLFHITDTDYFLVPTAEVPVTNYLRSEIVREEDLPICFTAYTPCFRSEAGSYGKDTKGLIRQHQFQKIEIVRFAHPEHSYAEHEKMVLHSEEILKRLELPYRTMALCSGDIGFGAAKCYDLEVWLPGQNAYREISSVSNFEDFQARRADIRFRPKDGGKPQFVHTLNGSGLAVGRTWIAILENYQREDGSIEIPKALQPYFDGIKEIRSS